MEHQAYAHTRPGQPPDQWEPLESHLSEVARLAGDHAAAFGARAWGEVAGHLHDLGKYSDEFQRYLRQTGDPDAGEEGAKVGRVDHSTLGAQHAAQSLGGGAGQLLAYVIAGHHAGLPDGDSDEATHFASTLRSRLERRVPEVAPHHRPRFDRPRLPFSTGAEPGFQIAFFARMLFSALVDADRTSTEQFCSPEAAAERRMPRPDIGQLNAAVAAHIEQLTRGAPSSRVNEVRALVVASCERAAPQTPGFFSLAVPTGGGKTLSALRFALEHAERHGLRRVVMAVPFTSIIEQTADVYRGALGTLGEAGLLEHHSGVDQDARTRASQMAAENWDAPLIVTTNVQLFDSLFAAATTPCRKLHRLARSVIVLDEAQTVPVDLLKPTLAALRELVSNYGCSVVLCTATQPALHHRAGFDIGIRDVRSIVPDPEALHQQLQRVRVTHLGTLDDEALVSRIDGHPSALCIVNTRAHAAELYRLMKAAGREVAHLSTLMCAAHRRRVLASIKSALQRVAPVVVISTQLVEAGVDVDFPVVFRAPAGWDSIAQAAGRCNREGRLAHGDLFTFDTPREPPPGFLRQAAAVGRELRASFPSDPLSPEAIEAFFRQLYWTQSHRWDHHGVLRAFPVQTGGPLLRLQFREAARAYQTIRDELHPILVPYDATASTLLRQLETRPADMSTLRRCQSYLVSVHAYHLTALLNAGDVIPHESGVHLLVNAAAYDRAIGLTSEGRGLDPHQLVC